MKPKRCRFSCCKAPVSLHGNGVAQPRGAELIIAKIETKRCQRAESHGRLPRARGKQRGEEPEPRCCSGTRPIRSHPVCLSGSLRPARPAQHPVQSLTVPGNGTGWEKTQCLNGVTGRDPASTGHRVAPVAITPHPESCPLWCANTPGPGTGLAQAREKEGPGTKQWLDLAQPRCREKPQGPHTAPVLVPAHPGPAPPRARPALLVKSRQGGCSGGGGGRPPQPWVPTGTPSPRSDSPTPPRWDPPGPPAPCPSRCLVSHTSRFCSASCERRSR